VTDQLTGLSGYQVDAWSRPYSMSALGDVLTIQSMGEDARLGTNADITIDLDVTYIRREKTLSRLKVINQAVLQYNAQWMATDPLPANYAVAYSKLVSRGYLPNSTDYQVDGWGVAYVEKPAGSTPVVEITSTSIESNPGGGGTGTGGGGTGTGGGRRRGPPPVPPGNPNPPGQGNGRGRGPR